MSNVSLVGVDSAGGSIVGPGNPDWTWDGKPISLLGDSIQPHGNSPHVSASIVEGSPWMTINGIPVTRAGSAASCGHSATGSSGMDVP